MDIRPDSTFLKGVTNNICTYQYLTSFSFFFFFPVFFSFLLGGGGGGGGGGGRFVILIFAQAKSKAVGYRFGIFTSYLVTAFLLLYFVLVIVFIYFVWHDAVNILYYTIYLSIYISIHIDRNTETDRQIDVRYW